MSALPVAFMPDGREAQRESPDPPALFSFSHGRNVSDTRGLSTVERSWEDFKTFILTAGAASDQKAGLYICAPLADGHRCAASAQPVQWCALDLDGVPDEQAMLRIVEAAERWRGMAYTTHSHAPEAGVYKMRLIFALDREVDRTEYAAVCRGVAAMLAADAEVEVVIDPACCRPEQALYTARKDATAWTFDGEPVSVDEALGADPGEVVAQAGGAAPAGAQDGRGVEGWLADLLAGEDLHNSALRLVGRMVSRRMEAHTIRATMEALLEKARPTRGDARVDALLAGELDRMIKGAEKFRAGGAEVEAGPAHPLARIVPVGETVEPPAWIIPGLVAEGVTVFAGMWGVGKTTALLPLAAAAAGLHEPDYPLAPKHWRHVLYVAEDLAQADRIVHGLARYLDVSVAAINERVHLVEARRMAPGELVKVGDHYREHFTRDAGGVALPPVVVLDTKAATIEMEDENSNSEASQAISSLKQDFADLPVWVVGHLAKQSAQKGAVLTARGAGAFEADAHQTMHLGVDAEGARARHWLRPAKTRFPPRWNELDLDLYRVDVQGVDRWGEPETVPLMCAIARPADDTDGTSQIGDAAAQELLDKQRAIGLLRLIAEFEARGQYCSPSPTARNNPYAMLRGEPEFIRLRLTKDDTRRLVNLCQREGWLEPIEYRTPDRKHKERWRVTEAGRTHAGLDSAPSAPSAPSLDEGAQGSDAQRGAPSAPSCAGGYGGKARTAQTAQKRARGARKTAAKKGASGARGRRAGARTKGKGDNGQT